MNQYRWALIQTEGLYDPDWQQIYAADLEGFIRERGGDVSRYIMETSHSQYRFVRWALPADDPEAERAAQRDHSATWRRLGGK